MSNNSPNTPNLEKVKQMPKASLPRKGSLEDILAFSGDALGGEDDEDELYNVHTAQQQQQRPPTIQQQQLRHAQHILQQQQQQQRLLQQLQQQQLLIQQQHQQQQQLLQQQQQLFQQQHMHPQLQHAPHHFNNTVSGTVDHNIQQFAQQQQQQQQQQLMQAPIMPAHSQQLRSLSPPTPVAVKHEQLQQTHVEITPKTDTKADQPSPSTSTPVTSEFRVINGVMYNDRGYEICGVLNQHNKPCQRIGKCPFHHGMQPKEKAAAVAAAAAAIGIEQQTIPSLDDKDGKKGKGASGKKSPTIKKAPFKQGWTKEEHFRFLTGLKLHSKGAWKEIAQIVGTRTPTQIQSHAQKYYLRQQQRVKNKRSIHDLSLEDLEKTVSATAFMDTNLANLAKTSSAMDPNNNNAKINEEDERDDGSYEDEDEDENNTESGYGSSSTSGKRIVPSTRSSKPASPNPAKSKRTNKHSDVHTKSESSSPETTSHASSSSSQPFSLSVNNMQTQQQQQQQQQHNNMNVGPMQSQGGSDYRHNTTNAPLEQPNLMYLLQQQLLQQLQQQQLQQQLQQSSANTPQQIQIPLNLTFPQALLTYPQLLQHAAQLIASAIQNPTLNPSLTMALTSALPGYAAVLNSLGISGNNITLNNNNLIPAIAAALASTANNNNNNASNNGASNIHLTIPSAALGALQQASDNMNNNNNNNVANPNNSSYPQQQQQQQRPHQMNTPTDFNSNNNNNNNNDFMNSNSNSSGNNNNNNSISSSSSSSSGTIPITLNLNLTSLVKDLASPQNHQPLPRVSSTDSFTKHIFARTMSTDSFQNIPTLSISRNASTESFQNLPQDTGLVFSPLIRTSSYESLGLGRTNSMESLADDNDYSNAYPNTNSSNNNNNNSSSSSNNDERRKPESQSTSSNGEIINYSNSNNGNGQVMRKLGDGSTNTNNSTIPASSPPTDESR